MNNKTLIAYLEQFEPEAEVFIYDNRDICDYTPHLPYGEYDLEEKKDRIIIPFGPKGKACRSNFHWGM